MDRGDDSVIYDLPATDKCCN